MALVLNKLIYQIASSKSLKTESKSKLESKFGTLRAKKLKVRDVIRSNSCKSPYLKLLIYWVDIGVHSSAVY